jgi:hypothetical protein
LEGVEGVLGDRMVVVPPCIVNVEEVKVKVTVVETEGYACLQIKCGTPTELTTAATARSFIAIFPRSFLPASTLL